MLREEEGRKLADKIMDIAKEHNKLISFDINFRDDIYSSTEEAKIIYLKYIKRADILKFSEDEVFLFTGSKDLSSINKIVTPNQLVFITLGNKGSYFQYKNTNTIVGSINIKPVDTTGAGDAFYACVLKHLNEIDISNLNIDVITDILKKANISGALACSKKGALSALPKEEELKEYL